MLEAAQYEENTFATLTYGDDCLPGDYSVTPREMALFIKRLRKRSGLKIRYFGCGEYGEQTGRPHYHIALFGFAGCSFGITRKGKTYCCPQCALVNAAWARGQILLGRLEQQSAAYIAGYVVKKWTAHDHPGLEGRLPEFARMSLRPGIGLGMMHELASCLMQHKLDEKMVDVPLSLQHGTQKWPLGRYLRRKLRTYIGRSPNTPVAAMETQAEELRALREIAWNTQTSVKSKVLEKSLGRRIQINANQRRKAKRETI